MGFVEIFLPIVAALITAQIIIEFGHFILGMWLVKRQQSQAKEYYKDIAEQLGISPEDLMKQMENEMTGGGVPGMMGGMMGQGVGPMMTTTVSGNTDNQEHGQYL